MANRDLLADAIADAKAVKEVAIANAKAALEEAFTPHLKDMLTQKINEMEDLEEMDLAEVDKEKQEEMKMKEEGYGKKEMEEAYDDSMEEELDLEEILAELELEEGEELEEANETNEGEEVKEGEDPMEEADITYEAEEGEEAEEEINLEDMSEEELKDMIEDVIEDMVASGELEAGGDPVEMVDDEEEEEEGGEEMEMDIETEEEPLNESLVATLATGLLGAAGVGGIGVLMQALEKVKEKKPNSEIGKLYGKLQKLGYGAGAATGMTAGKTSELEEELNEAKKVINTLRSDLNEVNLLNSKLLYTNKIFKAKNLTENQKIKVLKAFDKAETVKEAKATFETLSENLVAKSPKSNLRESRGAASRPAGVAPKRKLNEGIVQEDAMVARFKKLAGIN